MTRVTAKPQSHHLHVEVMKSKPNPDDCIVEDSEPEREEVRKLEKEERRKRRVAKRRILKKPPETIELSSDSITSAPPTKPTSVSHDFEHSVIVISGRFHGIYCFSDK